MIPGRKGAARRPPALQRDRSRKTGWEAWSCGVLAKIDDDHVAIALGLERALEAGMGVAFEALARAGVLGVVDELADHRAQMPDDDRRIELNAAVLAPAVFAGPGLDREIDQA